MHSIHLNVYRLQRNNTYINKYNIDLLIQRMENRRIDSLGSSFKNVYIYIYIYKANITISETFLKKKKY